MDSATSDRYRPKWKAKCQACNDEGVRFGILAKTIDEASEHATLFLESGVVYECVYACDQCDKGNARCDKSGGRKALMEKHPKDMIDVCGSEWVLATYQRQREIVVEYARTKMQGEDFTQQFD
jgi:hypothetical protein